MRWRLIVVIVSTLAVGTAASEEPITPLPHAAGLDPRRVDLGDRLFHDPRLSGGNTLACATCHRLAAAGDDGRALSTGARGRPLTFNTPSVFNAALNARLNWRGNLRTLEEHTEAVLLDADLMAAPWDALLAKLRADGGYRSAFAAAYGEGPTRANVLDAIATFERSLITPGARFDRYLAGERDALTAEEVRGYRLFQSYGCIACHQGANIGGNLFQRFGIFEEPPARGTSDLGRYGITGDPRDRRVFRVPSLRNVAATAPYFHDGRAATLTEAVEEMARIQLGRALTDDDIGLIVAFLRTLTGAYRGRMVDGGGVGGGRE